MSRLRVHSFSISIDGFGAGPDQDLENPLGVGGLKVFDWFFSTRTWQRMHGNADARRASTTTLPHGVLREHSQEVYVYRANALVFYVVRREDIFNE